MTSTLTHFTKSFPKKADITGSTKQAFHMQDNFNKYLQYVLGGIAAGTIAALGSIASSGTFQYLYASQIHHDLGGKPIGIAGTLSNKIGKFSCVHVKLSNLMLFPFVKAAESMNALLKHTNIIHLFAKHLEHTTGWKNMTDPIRVLCSPFSTSYISGKTSPRVVS